MSRFRRRYGASPLRVSRASPRSRSPASRSSSSSRCAAPTGALLARRPRSCSTTSCFAVLRRRPARRRRSPARPSTTCGCPPGLSELLLLVLLPPHPRAKYGHSSRRSADARRRLPRPLAAHHRRPLHRLGGRDLREGAGGSARGGPGRPPRAASLERVHVAEGRQVMRSPARHSAAARTAPRRCRDRLIGTPSNTRGSGRARPIAQ